MSFNIIRRGTLLSKLSDNNVVINSKNTSRPLNRPANQRKKSKAKGSSSPVPQIPESVKQKLLLRVIKHSRILVKKSWTSKFSVTGRSPNRGRKLLKKLFGHLTVPNDYSKLSLKNKVNSRGFLLCPCTVLQVVMFSVISRETNKICLACH